MYNAHNPNRMEKQSGKKVCDLIKIKTLFALLINILYGRIEIRSDLDGAQVVDLCPHILATIFSSNKKFYSFSFSYLSPKNYETGKFLKSQNTKVFFLPNKQFYCEKTNATHS